MSTAMKSNDLEECLKHNNKMKKRALYCSLNKNLVGYKIGIKPSANKSNSHVLIEEQIN